MPEETISAINFGEEYDKQEFGLIDDGKYEVTIEEILTKTSPKSGNQYLNFRLRIRKDVDQNFKNRVMFYTVTKKDGDACFDFSRINKIVLTQKDKPNYKARFLDFDEVLQYLHGLHLVVTIETEYYNGEDRNIVKDWSFEPSVWDATDHSTPVAEATSVTPATPTAPGVPDDDLPF